MEETIFLPVLSHFENDNFWTASAGRLRCRVNPVKEEGEKVPSSLSAQVWEGPWNLLDSRVEETRPFPLSEEGLAELRRWLMTWAGEINARPPKTLAQTIAERDARRAELAAAQAGGE